MADKAQVVVAQRGAREHFLVARALQRRGMFSQLVVDGYSPLARLGRIADSLGQLPMVGRAFGTRSADLDPRDVVSLYAYGLWRRLLERNASPSRRAAVMVRTDAAFARRVARLHLRSHDCFFGYAYASLEAMEAEARRNVPGILGQIDPGEGEYRLVMEEMERWPQYGGGFPEGSSEHFARNRKEWDAARLVVVNSDWSKQLLITDGAPSDKIRILPLAFEPDLGSVPVDRRRTDTLRVLWLGTACLRKGVQYLVEAARMLQDEPVCFKVVGRLEISDESIREAPPNIEWVGPVPRTQALGLYPDSDVFVLPTVSDGFAITQLEALSYGLPVIVTPNCGRVVEDGKTGFVVPARDAASLAESIRRFVREPALADRMGPACRAAAEEFSVDRYADGLADIVQEATGRERGTER